MTISTQTPLNRKKTAVLPVAAPVIDWIDRELNETFCIHQGPGGDRLLELRQAFSGTSLQRLLQKLIKVLPRLEKTHFLLGYRIRQWVALHYCIRVSDPLDRTPALTQPIDFAKHSSKDLKRHFFEQAKTVIPMNDIRIEVIPIPSKTPSTLQPANLK